MSHLQYKFGDGYDLQVGHLLRIGVTDADGGRHGESIVQIVNLDKPRWPVVEYLSASNPDHQWYIDKPGKEDRVPKDARLHVCKTVPSLCTVKSHSEVQHVNRLDFLNKVDAKALSKRWSDPLRKLSVEFEAPPDLGDDDEEEEEEEEEDDEDAEAEDEKPKPSTKKRKRALPVQDISASRCKGRSKKHAAADDEEDEDNKDDEEDGGKPARDAARKASASGKGIGHLSSADAEQKAQALLDKEFEKIAEAAKGAPKSQASSAAEIILQFKLW